MATLERVAPQMIHEDAMDIMDPTPFKWTKEQYTAMSDLGWFNDLKVELIEGEIYLMAAMGTVHFTGVHLANRALNRVFGDGYLVIVQSSFDADPRSEPAPDLAVYQGGDREFLKALPTSSLLFVEVSDSTLRYDRTKKASLYARSGIADYWIVNLKNRQIEIHREPQPMLDTPFGHGYASVTITPADGTISPLAKPDARISAADLLP